MACSLETGPASLSLNLASAADTDGSGMSAIAVCQLCARSARCAGGSAGDADDGLFRQRLELLGCWPLVPDVGRS